MRTTGVSPLHAVWLLVFLVDATLPHRDRAHALGALALLVLFATLVVGEMRSAGRASADDS
jgi:hypothetical protein